MIEVVLISGIGMLVLFALHDPHALPAPERRVACKLLQIGTVQDILTVAAQAQRQGLTPIDFDRPEGTEALTVIAMAAIRTAPKPAPRGRPALRWSLLARFYSEEELDHVPQFEALSPDWRRVVRVANELVRGHVYKSYRLTSQERQRKT